MLSRAQERHLLHEGVHVHDGGGERRGQMLQQQHPSPGEGGDHPQQDDHLPRHRGLPGAVQAAADDLVQGAALGDAGKVASVPCVCVTGVCVCPSGVREGGMEEQHHGEHHSRVDTGGGGGRRRELHLRAAVRLEAGAADHAAQGHR